MISRSPSMSPSDRLIIEHTCRCVVIHTSPVSLSGIRLAVISRHGSYVLMTYFLGACIDANSPGCGVPYPVLFVVLTAARTSTYQEMDNISSEPLFSPLLSSGQLKQNLVEYPSPSYTIYSLAPLVIGFSAIPRIRRERLWMRG